jgi:hypothetical protein
MVVSSCWFQKELEMSYERSSTDGDAGGGLSDSAVSGSQNSVGVQQRTTAEVASALLDGDDGGEVTRRSSGSTNDGVLREFTLGELWVLGNGRSANQSGSRKGNEDVFELHLE